MIPDALYAQIRHSMPIPCVDVVAADAAGRVLLLKRVNDPAGGQWWFPGGRVLHGESRADAARRKLWEECSLHVDDVVETITVDVFLPHSEGYLSHGITTVFVAHPRQVDGLCVDGQSERGAWFPISEALAGDMHSTVAAILRDPRVLTALNGGG